MVKAGASSVELSEHDGGLAVYVQYSTKVPKDFYQDSQSIHVIAIH